MARPKKTAPEAPLIETPEDLSAVLATGRLPPPLVICPTCGTEKTNNRCEVCGHQEHDE